MMHVPETKSVAPKEFTGRHMLIIMLAFFGVIISVNVTMATLAKRSWTGLEARNGYVASQDYNAKLAEADRQLAHGWQSELLHEGDAFTLIVKTSNGNTLAGARPEAQARRPVHDRDDRMLAFEETQPGHYRAIAPLQAGAWDIDVQFNPPGGEPYRQIFRILVKE